MWKPKDAVSDQQADLAIQANRLAVEITIYRGLLQDRGCGGGPDHCLCEGIFRLARQAYVLGALRERMGEHTDRLITAPEGLLHLIEPNL